MEAWSPSPTDATFLISSRVPASGPGSCLSSGSAPPCGVLVLASVLQDHRSPARKPSLSCPGQQDCAHSARRAPVPLPSPALALPGQALPRWTVEFQVRWADGWRHTTLGEEALACKGTVSGLDGRNRSPIQSQFSARTGSRQRTKCLSQRNKSYGPCRGSVCFKVTPIANSQRSFTEQHSLVKSGGGV